MSCKISHFALRSCFAIFEFVNYCLLQKNMLALIFANAKKFAQLKDSQQKLSV